jgi:uncharacterized protein YijF (DUF1287 family)
MLSAVSLALLSLLWQSPTQKIIEKAKAEVARGVVYDARYVRLSYPNGDVPADRGACTDVVIRALRNAGYDLQKLMHEDMRRNFRKYPKRYGLKKPDSSIDHRRTANQIVFFKRFGKELPKTTDDKNKRTWQPGDIVYWQLPNGLGHCGILSDNRTKEGRPLVIHNLHVTAEEDCLIAWKITGHFRFPKK